jgi:hypothetical protein
VTCSLYSAYGGYFVILSSCEFIIRLLCVNVECARHEIYFVGLIDILTHYGMKKRTAAAAKTVKYGAGAEISTVKPEQYARRFMEFIDRVVE